MGKNLGYWSPWTTCVRFDKLKLGGNLLQRSGVRLMQFWVDWEDAEVSSKKNPRPHSQKLPVPLLVSFSASVCFPCVECRFVYGSLRRAYFQFKVSPCSCAKTHSPTLEIVQNHSASLLDPANPSASTMISSHNVDSMSAGSPLVASPDEYAANSTLTRYAHVLDLTTQFETSPHTIEYLSSTTPSKRWHRRSISFMSTPVPTLSVLICGGDGT